MDSITATAIIASGSVFGQKLLGPTLDAIGKDIQQLYEKGKEQIALKALSKIPNIDDGKKANLRVTRDVFWNGAYTDESICAEYFGGILAASRSEDGKDDTGVFYVDIIKSMSSAQLKTHYILYRTLNKELISNITKKDLNPGMQTALNREAIFIPLVGVIEQLNTEDIGPILTGLHSKDLIQGFQSEGYKTDQGVIPYIKVQPTILGVQLFAIANNKFDSWRNYSTLDFGDFEDIVLPQFYGPSIDILLERAGIKK